MKTNFKIGDLFVKSSGKPFKSTFKVGTIISIEINEQCPKKLLGARFLEDDSIVNLDKLELYRK